MACSCNLEYMLKFSINPCASALCKHFRKSKNPCPAAQPMHFCRPKIALKIEFAPWRFDIFKIVRIGHFLSLSAFIIPKDLLFKSFVEALFSHPKKTSYLLYYSINSNKFAIDVNYLNPPTHPIQIYC